MQELIDRDRIKENSPEINHLIPCCFRIKYHSHRMLHPGVSYQDPECREICSDSYKPGRNKMKLFIYFIPAEKHNCYESRFEEESQNTLDCQRRTKNICLLYTSPSPRDGLLSRMPSSA